MATSFDPDQIRQMRGSRSRAAFARAVGVTPQTVYRWELPPDAAEARSPRGTQLERLIEYARSSAPASRPLLPPPPGVPGNDIAPRSTTLSPPTWVDDDVSRLLPSLERVWQADLRRAHGELVQAVASSKPLSPNARAAAYVGIALCELFDRSDARAALLAIAPLLHDAESGRLSAPLAAKLLAVAALCHAFPDAMLFDLGRVQAYQDRVEAISQRSDNEASCIAALAGMCAATLVGDMQLLERGFNALENTRGNGLPPLLELHVEELRTMRMLYAGKPQLSIQSCEAVIARAEQLNYPLLQARTLTRLALCHLDVLTDPEQVLSLVRRGKSLTRAARIGPGIHQPLAARAEIEALLRLGRTDEALAVADETEAWTAETGIPAFPAVTAQTRLFVLTGKFDALSALGLRLRSCEVPSLRMMCQASASHVEACFAFARNEDPELTVALFEQAQAQAERWPFLMREVLLYRVYAHLGAAQEAQGRIALRRAQRYVDGFPSPWYTAHLRRLEGGLLAVRGHWVESRQLLQSAIATFELAKDKPDAAITRYLYRLIADAVEKPNKALIEESRAELAALGLPEPPNMRDGVARFNAQRRSEESALESRAGASSERLVVPFQRVAMRGAAPNLILSELVAVANSLFPGRAVSLEELDSSGRARLLFGAAFENAERESAEFSDGGGRLLRLGVEGELDRDQRSTLSLLTLTAALSLEVAVLRNLGERASPDIRESLSPELPGFIAASAEMRRLRSELVRLSGSRSTVIITGESGAGKELVARAIHDLSERADQPYVAFNCATVPRDLFEGQLFGYRRGAFTGATSDHIGVVRAANRGTLFLDEIGELPLDIQPKLLRFLENSEVFPLGERAPVRVDVRVLAATHRDLTALVQDGKFREDLYYRLQVVPVFVPPLRERRADVPVLARHFLRQLTRSGEPPVLAPDALTALLEERFPGNVRELKNVIERALAYYPDQAVLRAEHLRLPTPAVRRA